MDKSSFRPKLVEGSQLSDGIRRFVPHQSFPLSLTVKVEDARDERSIRRRMFFPYQPQEILRLDAEIGELGMLQQLLNQVWRDNPFRRQPPSLFEETGNPMRFGCDRYLRMSVHHVPK